MNILVVGKSGVGKSLMGDLIKNTIFRLDSDSTVNIDDPDRDVKVFGRGSNIYSLKIKRDKEGQEEIADITVIINGSAFSEWYKSTQW